MINIMILISFFLSTLANHSAFTIPLAILFMIPAIIKYKCQITKKGVISYLLVLFLILIYAVLFIFNIPSYIQSQDLTLSFPKNLVKYILLLTLVYIYMWFINKTSQPKLHYILSVILLIHITMFYIQLVTIYSFNYYIDFVFFITGEHSRYLMYGANTSIDIYRCTGLYAEPSTYAISILILTSLYQLTAKKASNYILLLSYLSIFLSFSSISYFILLYLLLSFFILKFYKKNKTLFIIALIFLLSLSFISIDLINVQIEKIINTSGIRIALVIEIIQRPLNILIFGSGLFGLEQHIMEGSRGLCIASDCTAQINRTFATPNDVGILFYSFMKFGILTFPIVLYLVHPFIKNKSKMIFFTCILFTKIQFAFPLFWLFILILRKDYNNEK